ncbi:MAG: putative cytosolic protein [Firmicutes bacterium]|nr:putative cytosolic protein [Bacillota bacterium]
MDKRVVIDRDLADLIPGFIEKRQQDIAAIMAAAAASDYETIQSIGHNLKGIGGGYGFDRITRLGAAIEQAGKLQEADKVRELVQAMKTYIETVEISYE